MSIVHEKLTAFLARLDTNDRQRAVDALVSFYDEYVTSIPLVPDKWGKKTGRPHVVKAVEKLVADWCGQPPASVGEAIGQMQAAVFGGIAQEGD